MNSIIFFLLFIPFTSVAQLSKADSLWLPFTNLIGTWKGAGEGIDGKGNYERSYQFVLDKKYIEVKNKSTYPPTTDKPKGYVHEDIGYISYDKIRKRFIFRQFHSEGFINQYVLESTSGDGKTIVFISESIENIPAGWRAKETYKVTNGGEFSEVFELAEPGKDFTNYSKASFNKMN
jgi:THAP4-like, heme-binding beta-barrel domain